MKDPEKFPHLLKKKDQPFINQVSVCVYSFKFSSTSDEQVLDFKAE